MSKNPTRQSAARSHGTRRQPIMPAWMAPVAARLQGIPECFIYAAIDERISAGFDLCSGRQVLARLELVRRDDFAILSTIFEDVHDDDMREVTGLHGQIVLCIPEITRALQGASNTEVV